MFYKLSRTIKFNLNSINFTSTYLYLQLNFNIHLNYEINYLQCYSYTF